MDLKKWFTEVVASALKQGVIQPKHVLAHVKPEVLSRHLPAELMSKVLDASLRAKAMTPEGVLEVVTPKLLAAHIPLQTVWGCVVQEGEASGLKGNGKDGSAEQKKFLQVALAQGLTNKVLSPEDIVRHANPEVLASSLSVALKAKLLQAGLDAAAMTPSLVVDTLGTKALAEYVPVPVLWGCVHEAGTKAVGKLGKKAAGKPGVADDEAGKKAVGEPAVADDGDVAVESFEDPEEWAGEDILEEEFEEMTNA